MIRHNFCRSDGRLVKLFLFSTLLHKSSLTSIYFATFEKKREVRSPLPTEGCEILEVRGDLSISVENKKSPRVDRQACKHYALALTLCAFNNSKSI